MKKSPINIVLALSLTGVLLSVGCSCAAKSVLGDQAYPAPRMTAQSLTLYTQAEGTTNLVAPGRGVVTGNLNVTLDLVSTESVDYAVRKTVPVRVPRRDAQAELAESIAKGRRKFELFLSPPGDIGLSVNHRVQTDLDTIEPLNTPNGAVDWLGLGEEQAAMAERAAEEKRRKFEIFEEAEKKMLARFEALRTLLNVVPTQNAVTSDSTTPTPNPSSTGDIGLTLHDI